MLGNFESTQMCIFVLTYFCRHKCLSSNTSVICVSAFAFFSCVLCYYTLLYSYRKQEDRPRRLGEFRLHTLDGKYEQLQQKDSPQTTSNSASVYRGKPSSVPSSIGFTKPNIESNLTKNDKGTAKASYTQTERPKSINANASDCNLVLTVSSAISSVSTESERIMRPKSRRQRPTKSNVDLLQEQGEINTPEAISQEPERSSTEKDTCCESTITKEGVLSTCVLFAVWTVFLCVLTFI